MDDPIGSTTWAPPPPPPPAQTQTPSTVPAKSAKSPSVAGPAGPPVVNAPPVAKDGSKPPGSEKPKGRLLTAAALQSASSLGDDTLAAIAEVKRLAKLKGKSPEFEGACEHLLRAVSDEIIAMVGPKPGIDALRRAGDALVHRAGLLDKSIVAAAVEVVFERLVTTKHVVMGEQLPAVENIWRSVMGVATGFDSRVAGEFPSLLIWDDDFRQASHQFDVVNTLNNLGTPVLKESIDKLQDAANFRRDAWQKAVDKSDDPELQRGLNAANHDAERVNAPLFVELHENPAFARGERAELEFEGAKVEGNDLGIKNAAKELSAAWQAAVKDARARNPDYAAECGDRLQSALRNIQESLADPEHVTPIYDLPPPL